MFDKRPLDLNKNIKEKWTKNIEKYEVAFHDYKVSSLSEWHLKTQEKSCKVRNRFDTSKIPKYMIRAFHYRRTDPYYRKASLLKQESKHCYS